MPENHASPSSISLPAPDFSVIDIPPRPALLLALQREIQRDNPDTKRIDKLVRRDPAMAGALLRNANSAFFSKGRHVTTVEDAIFLMGLNQCDAVMSGFLVKKSLAIGGMMMPRFWDVSEKRAISLNFLAREMRIVLPGVAYSFGLFCDIGIPLLKVTFSAYLKTLAMANRKAGDEFLKEEDSRHGINHASVGGLLAERWSLSPDVAQAIRMHHDHDVLHDDSLNPAVRILVALNLVVEKAIQEYRGKAESLEWLAGGEIASEVLGISHAEADSLCEALKNRLSAF